MEIRDAILDPTSDEIEAFEEHRLERNLVALKTGILITLFIQVPFMFYEWIAIANHFWTLQLLRIVLIGTAIALGVAISSNVALQRHVDFVTFGIFAICAAFIIAAAFFDKGYASPYSDVLVMMLVGVGFVTLWTWSLALLFSATVYGMYWVPILIGMGGIEDARDFVGYQLFICGMILVIIVSQQLWLRLERSAFHGKHKLEMAKASLELTNERLKELDEQKSDFFANVSHELRTPLTLSLGPLESLLKMEHTAEAEQHLQALHRNQLRLLRLINQLLDVAKVESGKAQAEYSKEDIVEVVRELAAEVDEATRAKGLRLDVVVPSKPVWLFIDREKFEQLLLNLLSNAFKFTERGGQIEVSVMRGRDSTQIAVRDTGTGIPESKLPTIFDRFTQADTSETRQYPGTGIGLALVQSYVELHGGTIRVESELGIGTTFTVSLRQGKAHLRDDQIRRTSRPATMTSVRPPQLVDFEVDEDDEPVVERAAEQTTSVQQTTTPSWSPRSRKFTRRGTGCPVRSIPTARNPGCSWSTIPPTCGGTCSHFSATNTTCEQRRTGVKAWRSPKSGTPISLSPMS